ncbi:transporter associated domain-containing protein [Azonexus hydrophilus]|jgi:magnesium and cobalt transporter|uniref:HlyC/CorC family transporter n=1 Tax=Azonexus hydrophilus TaxID=418702 RepID=UPI0019642F52|nr:transporter associated domain-containing protein [Azonexus hydrophilus]
MDKPSFIERLSSLLLRAPEDRAQLLQILQTAHEKNLLDADALGIIQGALAASETPVTEVMIPRSQTDVIDASAPFDIIRKTVIISGHSRFPVIEGDRDNVLGILLAKDLLRQPAPEDFNLRQWLRPAVFIPESKRLDVLLREFRVSRNHMAIVVNEYGGMAGLVTIEDVLEQIVGNIEDEYDLDQSHDNIRRDAGGRFVVKASTSIEDFNTAFCCDFPADEFDTIGGFLLGELGYVAKRNEIISLAGIRFQVLRADSRRLYTLLVDLLPPTEEQADD